MALIKIRIHQSVIRPHLVMGGDREITLLTMLAAFVLIFVCMQWWTTLTAVFLWIFILMIVRKMAKLDPLMRHIYLRHIQYVRYYPALSRPWHVNPRFNRAIEFLSRP